MDTLELGSVHPTAVISTNATLGTGVTVGPFAVIHEGVQVGDRCVVGSHCVLGEPTGDFYSGSPSQTATTTVIGADAVIRSHSVLYQGVIAGPGFRTGHRVTIREGSRIGDDVQVGTMSDLQGNLEIGNHTRLHSNVFVAQLSVIEDFVWLFPHVVLTNDPHPPSDTCTRGPQIRRFAAIGAGAMILPGIEIGEHALVGAMSLVTRDVEPETVVVGVPAKATGSVRDVACRHGALEAVYPWPQQFRRGYPEGALPDVDEFR